MSDYSRKYLKRAKRAAKLLNLLPFVRCVILNGSVARNCANKDSDIDLLIVAKDNRIFTCRFFCVGLVKLLGVKRPKDETKPHPGKFCLNYFMTEHHLTIPHQREEKINQYCAKNYSHSRFLVGDSRIFKHFVQCNVGWWKKYGYEVELKKYHLLSGGNIIKIILEYFLTDGIEAKIKGWQLHKIEKDNLFRVYPDLVVCNDFELRFHPPRVGDL